jgi:hypothetical protein
VRERRARKVTALDRTHVYVVDRGARAGTVSNVHLAPGARVTAAITVQAPDDAQPGDRYRLDVLQRSGGHVVGGSSYVLVVTRPR